MHLKNSGPSTLYHDLKILLIALILCDDVCTQVYVQGP